MRNDQSKSDASRRGFIKATAVAGTFAALGSNFAHAAGTDTIKVGVIGAGGRGSGACGNHMNAAKLANVNSQIVAVGEMSAEAAKNAKTKYKIPDNKTFLGFNAYKELLATDVDLVILATPPGFRPFHFEAAIAAGKHVFMEKPVATDPVNLRKVFAAADQADEKKLCVITGTQRRHQTPYVESIKRLHDGAIGDILHMSVFWNGSGIWWKPRLPNETEMEYQVRNWYHHIWLCGDQIVEQHIHNLDVANWVMNDHPAMVYGSGGRQVRKEPGEIWDHFVTDITYANGGHVLSMCRHWPQSDDSVSEMAVGSKGVWGSDGNTAWIVPTGGEKQIFPRAQVDPYVQEHVDLLNMIKTGGHVNEAKRVAESTLTAIMSRMSCYTGRRVSWDFARNKSQLDIFPKELGPDVAPPPLLIPEPGKTKLV
jgi:myo-inositol 2-dehydrogenase/D-chiro-inositol 1-dehydrogenase